MWLPRLAYHVLSIYEPSPAEGSSCRVQQLAWPPGGGGEEHLYLTASATSEQVSQSRVVTPPASASSSSQRELAFRGLPEAHPEPQLDLCMPRP